MKTVLRRVLFFPVAVLLLASSGTALGAACTAQASTAWNVKTTWGTAANGCAGSGLGIGETPGIPGASDTVSIGVTGTPRQVTIPGGYTALASTVSIGGTGTNGISSLTLSAANSGLTVSGAVTIRAPNNNNANLLSVGAGTASTGSITLNEGSTNNRLTRIAIAGGSLTVNGNLAMTNASNNARTVVDMSGGGNMTITGSFTLSSTFGTLTPGAGTVTFTTGSTATIAGGSGIGYPNLVINKSGATATLATGNATVAGDLTVNAGSTLDLSTFTLNRASAGGTITVGANGALRIGGTNGFPGNYATHALYIDSTVEYYGANQSVGAAGGSGYGFLTLSGSGTKTAAGSFTVRRDLSITGVTFAGGTTVQTVNRNISNTGTHTASTGSITLSGGSAAHVLSGTGSYANLVMNDTNGATLSANVTVSGTLTLTDGIMSTGANTLITSANCPGSVSRTGGHVAGSLRMAVPTGSPVCTFHVGDATLRRQIDLTFASVTVAGNLTAGVSQSAGDHPNIATSGLDSTNSANRYWTLTNAGVAFTNYSIVLNFDSSDLDAGATPADFEIERWDGAAWNTTTVGTRTATSTEATAVTALSDFAAAKKKPAVVTPGGFNAYEVGTAGLTGVINTKVGGTSFNLDVIALNAAKTAILPGFNGKVRVQVVDASSGGAPDANGCVDPGWGVVHTVSPDPEFFIADAGRKSISFTVPEVYRNARVKVYYPHDAANYTAASAKGCSNDNFAIRPQSITISAHDATWETAGTTRTLSNTAASGGVVHKASTSGAAPADQKPFTLRATPVVSSGTAANYDGSPTVISGFPACGTLCSTVGTLSFGSWTSAGGGVRETATAHYSEAGTFTLRLEDTGYASVDNSDGTPDTCSNAPPFGKRVCSPATATEIGRFVPDHFIVAPNNAPQFQTFGLSDGSCNTAVTPPRRSFTYIGQFFGYITPPQALVTARNAGGGTTLNYRDSLGLWKITTGAPSDVTLTYSNNAVGPALVAGTGANNLAPAVASLNNGTGTVTLDSANTLAYTRATAAGSPIGPFNANISLTVSARDDSESDGQITTKTATAFTAMAFDSGNEFRYGRLRLFNANGSQLVPLLLRAETQYYSGAPTNGFLVNVSDHCTSIAANNITLAGYTRNLTDSPVCSTAVSVAGGAAPFSSGRRQLMLAAPGGGNNGSVDLTANLGTAAGNTCLTPGAAPVAAVSSNLSHLKGNWTGTTFTQDPTGRGTFGAFPGAEEVIFIREIFGN